MGVLTNFKHLLQRYGMEAYNRYYAQYKGFVADRNDPSFRGRIKVRVPQIYGEQVPEYWALPVGMYAGNNIGMFAIPNVGDPVWVTFENGNARYPLWTYGWYMNDKVPSVAKVNGNSPDNVVIQSTTGHKIELDDHNGVVRITDKKKNILELNDKGVSIVSDNISIGKLDKSLQAAVHGDTLVDVLKELLDDLGLIGAITTNTGTTLTLNTSPQWLAFIAKWSAKFNTVKSNKVTLE